MAKLQLRQGDRLVVLHRPSGLDLGMGTSGPDDPLDPDEADAVLLFAAHSADLRGADGELLVEAARRDAVVWVAYPKAGSTATDLSRESLAAALREQGLRPVRQMSIDRVWSAVRFRPQA